MDNDQFVKLVEALSHTSLVDSLSHVQYGGNWHSPALTESQVRSAFSSNGFSVQLDSRMSSPLEQGLF